MKGIIFLISLEKNAFMKSYVKNYVLINTK